MLKTTIRLSTFVLIAVSLTGCVNLWDLLFPPPPPTQQPGKFATYAVNTYNCIDRSQWPTQSQIGADNFAGHLNRAAWNQINGGTYVDYAVTGSSLSQNNGNIDTLFFQGHGDTGMALLSQFQCGQPVNAQAWGVGSSSGYINLGTVGNPNRIQFTPSKNGLPIGGELKWIIMYSSDSVAAPPTVDPGDSDWTADWSKAFGGTLHGVYGAWQHPDISGCNNDGSGRSCDVLDDAQPANLFGAYSMPNPNSTSLTNQGSTVYNAWTGALQNAGYDNTYGIWEDTFAHGDILSGPGNGAAPPSYTPVLQGVPQFYYQQSISGNVMTPAAIHPDTFTLNPRNLQNEAINHTALLNQYSNYLSTPAVNDDGKLYTVRQFPVVFEHAYGSSGAVFYLAQDQTTSLGFSVNTAQQAAAQFMQQSLGMPSDAVLTSTLERWQITPMWGMAIPMGYEFIWTHANGMAGGDAIKVVVDDRQTTTRTCTNWSPGEPPPGPPIHCIAWNVTVTDSPNISYAYRLWRSLGAVNPNLQPAGQTSIDAVTASASVPIGNVITAYRAGLWSPRAMQNSSLGARSAWIFTLNGMQDVAVDAASGKILGSTFYH